MPALSLLHLARTACMKHINSLTDIGDAEYSLVRPILLKLQNPRQLWQLEQQSPQIIGVDAEIWREFCKRDIPNYEKDPVEPANPRSWYKCYLKLQKAAQKEVEKDAALLKAELAGIKSKQDQNQALQVDLGGVIVPPSLKKDLPKIWMPRGSGVWKKDKSNVMVDPNTLAWQKELGPIAGYDMAAQRRSRQRAGDVAKSKTNAAILKIRKDALAHQRFPKTQSQGVLSSTELSRRNMENTRKRENPANSTVTAAPRSMVENYQRAKAAQSRPIDSTNKAESVFSPRKRRIDEVDVNVPSHTNIQNLESRLKAIKSSPNTSAPDTATIRPTPATQTFQRTGVISGQSNAQRDTAASPSFLAASLAELDQLETKSTLRPASSEKRTHTNVSTDSAPTLSVSRRLPTSDPRKGSSSINRHPLKSPLCRRPPKILGRPAPTPS